MPPSSPSTKIPGYLTWPAIIVLLVIFWPGGLVLLGMRLSIDRSRQMILGGVFKIVGGLFGTLFALIGIACFVLPEAPPSAPPSAREAAKTIPGGIEVERADPPASPPSTPSPDSSTSSLPPAPSTQRHVPEVPSGHQVASRDAAIGGGIICLFISSGFYWLMIKGVRLQAKRRMVQRYIDLLVNRGLTRIEEIAIALGRPDFNGVMREIEGLIKEGFLPGYRLDVEERLVTHYEHAHHTAEEVGFICKSCGANNMVLAVGGFVRCDYCGTPVKVSALV